MSLKAEDVAMANTEYKALGKLVTAIRTAELNKNNVDLKTYVSVFDNLYIENDLIFNSLTANIFFLKKMPSVPSNF